MGGGGGGGEGYVLLGHCSRQQISVKTEGYLFTGVYGIVRGQYGEENNQAGIFEAEGNEKRSASTCWRSG